MKSILFVFLTLILGVVPSHANNQCNFLMLLNNGANLLGKTYSMTGTMDGVTRDELAGWIMSHNGIFSPEVTKKVDILIVGEKAGSKVTKAQKLGIQTLPFETFKSLYSQKVVAEAPAVKTPAPKAEVKKVTGPIDSLAQWKLVDKETKRDIIDGYSFAPEVKNSIHLERVSLSDLKDRPAAYKFAEKIEAFMKDQFDFTPEREYGAYAFVGSPRVTFDIVMLSDGTVLGGSINIYQDGMMTADEDYARFETKEEGLAAGAEDSDVSWGAHGYFDHNGESLQHDYMMEWTGH